MTRPPLKHSTLSTARLPESQRGCTLRVSITVQTYDRWISLVFVRRPLGAFCRFGQAVYSPRMPEPCPACDGNAHNHAALWISHSGDVLALGFAKFRNAWIVRTLATLGEWTIALIGGMFFSVGRALGAFTLGDDVTLGATERARVIWREANRRGIPMQQVCAFGKPLDLYRIEVHGKKYLVDSIPIPMRKQKEALHIDDKVSFKELLARAGLPAPISYSAGTLRRAKEILAELSLVCVKPRSGSNGLHTYPFVSSEAELEKAFMSAKQICYLLSVEEHLEGNLCRATCVDGKLVGFLESAYPTVIGDGVSRVAELIQKQEKIVMTPAHHDYIARRGYTVGSVLPSGVELPLTYRAGGSWGGSNLERGRAIHESFISIIERAAALTELPVVGFDIIIPNPLAPQSGQRWGFIEANSLPWINLHHAPIVGESVNVAKHVWDLWES